MFTILFTFLLPPIIGAVIVVLILGFLAELLVP